MSKEFLLSLLKDEIIPAILEIVKQIVDAFLKNGTMTYDRRNLHLAYNVK